MIAVVALQFAGANLGAHQLHLGSHEEESETHPHLQFTAEIVSFAQCLDCQCEFDQPFPEHEKQHDHQFSKTETKTFDLCLDCQCHGGHVTLVSQVSVMPSVPVGEEPSNLGHRYFSPEQQPSYRPPIA
nr:hypothetical protein [Shewanella psychrotolerans]